MIDVERTIEKYIDKAHSLGASEVEIHIVERETSSVTMLRRDLDSIKHEHVYTVDVRVAVGKKVAVQGAIISNEGDVEEVLERTLSIAKAAPEDLNWVTLPRSYGYTQVWDIVDKKIEEFGVDLLINIVNELSHISEEFSRKASIDSIHSRSVFMRKWIGNSYESRPFSYEKTELYLSIVVKTTDIGAENTYAKHYAAPTLKELSLESLVRDAVEIAVLTSRPKPVETGIYNVVFAPHVFASILNALIVPAIRADQVQKNRSPLSKRLFDSVLSDDITIIDDGAAPNMINSAPFDDEGVATKRKTVFDNGVLMTYLYDTYTAYIDNQESTGNAVRLGLGVAPTPNALNIIVVPGTEHVESIIKDSRDVIVVYDVDERFSNPVNGRLVATITNAVYFRNGEPVHGIKGAIMSGDVYRLLSKDYVALSREVDLVLNMLLPYVCVRNVTIASDKS